MAITLAKQDINQKEFKCESKNKDLSQVQVGKDYKVSKIKGKGALKRRILDMGLTKGTVFNVRRTAPLGDPVQISLRGYELTIRRQDGKLVEIEEV